MLEVLPSVASSELPALVELIEARRAGKSLSSETCAADLGLSDAAEKLRVRFGATDLFDEIGPDADVLRVVAHPISDGFFGQQSFPELIRSFGDKTPQSVFLLIGPVGGFSDGEVSTAVEAGWKPLDLGAQVYRVETAAIVAAALFLHLK